MAEDQKSSPDLTLANTLATMVGRDLEATKLDHRKHYEYAYRILFQLTILFLSGWVTLIAAGKVSYGTSNCWTVYVAPALHVLCLVLLGLNSFNTFMESRKRLLHQIDFFEAIADFQISSTLTERALCDGDKRIEVAPPSLSNLAQSLEKWRASQKEAGLKSECLVLFGSITFYTVMVSTLFSAVTLLFVLFREA